MVLNTKRTVLLILLLLIYWLICTPIIAYNCFKFWQNRRNQIIHKRYPLLTVYLCSVSLLGVAIYTPIWLFAITYDDSSLAIGWNYVAPFIYAIIGYTFGYNVVLRFWMLFYDVRIYQATQEAKWKVYLTEDISESWFIKNRHKYGHLSYIIRIASIPCIISMIAVSSTDYLYTNYYPNDVIIQLLWTALNFIAFISQAIFVATLWFKTKKINDNFCMVKEGLMTTKVGLTLMITYLFVAVSTMFGAGRYLRHILGNIMGVCWYFFFSVFNTSYALKLIMKGKRKKPLRHRDIIVSQIQKTSSDVVSLSPVSSVSYSMTPSPKTRYGVDEEMSQTLAHEDSFNAFLFHLRKEFSLELLLCFIELVQFKQSIISSQCVITEKKEDDKDYVIPPKFGSVLKNDGIPESFLIYGDMDRIIELNRIRNLDQYIDNIEGDDMDEKDMQIRGYLLYMKYVDVSSELQINLSNNQSFALKSIFMFSNKLLTPYDMFKVYDASLHELWKLMRHSFVRFRKTL